MELELEQGLEREQRLGLELESEQGLELESEQGLELELELEPKGVILTYKQTRSKMKRLVEDEATGYEVYIGKKVTLYGLSYIYAGILKGVSDEFFLLGEAELVYDTGGHSDSKWADSAKMPHGDWCVMKSQVESFGIFK